MTRPLGLRLLLRDHAQAAGVRKTDAGIKWPYQPKHSPSDTCLKILQNATKMYSSCVNYTHKPMEVFNTIEKQRFLAHTIEARSVERNLRARNQSAMVVILSGDELSQN